MTSPAARRFRPPPPLLRLFQNPRQTPTPRWLLKLQARILTDQRLQYDDALLLDFITFSSSVRGPSYTSLFLRHLPGRTSTSSLWNTLVKSHSQSHPGNMRFLDSYAAMCREGIRPEPATFSIIIRCSISSPKLKAGESLHCQVYKFGFASHVFLATGILDYYAKTGDINLAEKVFAEMPEKDVVANNAMIGALSNKGRVQEARHLFDGMRERSRASWNSIITCYCMHGDLESAREIFDRNPVKDVISWNAMIDGYCKLGHIAMARELFDKMGSAKNPVTWNTMISGYVQRRDFGSAILFFGEMQAVGIRPTEVTMVSLLSACANVGALDMGRWIHTYIQNHNLQIDVVLGNALIDMYYKCGSLENALEVFHSLSVKNIYCWNSIILGLGMHGHGRDAIEAFFEMVNEKMIKPDGITFVGLLYGCSHAGLVAEGRSYFSQMREIYGIEPQIEHYGCMVDLLGRAGFLAEAFDLINGMPIKPNCVVWGSLLRACRIHKDTKLSEQVTQHLLQLDPKDGANYVFLSNIYASVSRWDDVEKCRRIMLEKRLRKIPGCSSVEVDNVVHEFVAGDTSHPQFQKISNFLDEISIGLRKLGYEADVNSVLHDIEDEEKEIAVKYHSERIAIAFGLMNIGEGKPIRIMKNLRVCYDCHEALKLISKLHDRDIIVRDRSRFHQFREGLCSCKDYW